MDPEAKQALKVIARALVALANSASILVDQKCEVPPTRPDMSLMSKALSALTAMEAKS